MNGIFLQWLHVKDAANDYFQSLNIRKLWKTSILFSQSLESSVQNLNISSLMGYKIEKYEQSTFKNAENNILYNLYFSGVRLNSPCFWNTSHVLLCLWPSRYHYVRTLNSLIARREGALTSDLLCYREKVKALIF